MDQNLDINMATQALALAPFGVCITDENDQLVYGNKTLFQIFQVEDSEQTQDLAQLPALADAIKNKEAYIELDAQNDMRKRTIKCWHHESTGKANTYFFLDVTDKKALHTEKTQLEDELSRLSTRDKLTGLPNKIALLQGLEPLISRSRRYSNPLSVVHLDLDIEGADDHESDILRLSHMLRDQMRWADMIGRLDESKFLLILPETPEDAANILVDKLNAKITALKEHNGLDINTYFGVANWTTGDDSRLLLKRAAEIANNKREASAA